jgi:hypothetical protein
MRLGTKDQHVIASFVDGRPLEGYKLSTDGRRLDGHWLGGARLAEWHKGQIHLPDTGGRIGQSIQRAVRRYAAPIDLADYKTFGERERGRDPGASSVEVGPYSEHGPAHEKALVLQREGVRNLRIDKTAGKWWVRGVRPPHTGRDHDRRRRR